MIQRIDSVPVEAIRGIREGRGHTLAQAALHMGLSDRTLRAVEQEAPTSIHARTRAKLESYLGATVKCRESGCTLTRKTQLTAEKHEEIRTLCRDAVAKWHPDRGLGMISCTAVVAVLNRIQEALK